jgi:GDP-mannose 6-dehydrogenase
VLSALPHGDGPMIVDLIHLPDADARRTEPGYMGLAW